MSNKKTPGNDKFLLRLPPELKAQLEEEAKEQNRSLNGHILYWLQNRGKETKQFNFQDRVTKYLEWLKDDSNKGKEFKL